MGRKTRTKTEFLNGIVLFLLALADLAERAAGRSRPVRWLVLWRLGRAHDVARDFVAGSAGNAAGRHRSPALTRVRRGYDPADAMKLASSLRALARMVRTMAAHAGRLSVQLQGEASGGRSQDGGQAARLDALVRVFANAVVSPVPLHDTS